MTHPCTNWTDAYLIKTLVSVTSTMMDIESGKMKLPSENIQKVGANANALTDELERRELTADFIAAVPASLRTRMTKRGIK